VDVVDLGPIKTEWQGDERIRDMVRLVWQIDTKRQDGTRHLVFGRYTNSLHPKSRLRHDLVSWRGRDFRPDEEAQFDLERLIGVPCELVIVHATSNGTTYANVSAVIPAAKGSPRLQPEGYTRVVDRKAPDESEQTDEPETEDFNADDDDVPF